ncbi:uncharacterized protein LOC132861576 [Tachysurus vachellii]|uniref:uncharacterized protein LOC132861576 n=1 Tax=Tachysurus vachellii TaxID=175792 RepID=UPI00296AA60B|nr:uncharacterized protein LOC132861576 [Tachysurus vachellii]
MHKKSVFCPGCIKVVFRKGPLGYLLQDPTEEARVIKDNPALQDKSAPKKEELVRQNALAVVRQRGGDASDKREVLGEYILQFGKYKGKSFRWLLENDMGYTIYLIKNLQQEEAMGVFTSEGPSKSSLLSFSNYACSFNEIQSLLSYVSKNPGVPAASSEVTSWLVLVLMRRVRGRRFGTTGLMVMHPLYCGQLVSRGHGCTSGSNTCVIRCSLPVRSF